MNTTTPPIDATREVQPTMDLTQLMASYPRLRPPLPEAHRRLYEREYKLNREGDRAVEALAKRLEGWMHREVAKRPGGPLLELGAGTLNHMKYEPGVTAYDIVEPMAFLYDQSPRRKAVRHAYASLAEVPDDQTYARIVSVAVLEHMTDLPAELARCCRHLRPGGVFQAGIPSQGGALWWLGWRGTTGISYWLRNRLDYGALMRHEHVNTAKEIVAIVSYFFRKVAIKRFPFPFHHASLYVYIEAEAPIPERAAGVPPVFAKGD